MTGIDVLHTLAVSAVATFIGFLVLCAVLWIIDLWHE